ncbi:MAG: hypothetical protein ACRD0G_08475 [Acidimicrobiales bacterium]
MTATQKVSRDDLESKFRELRGEVDTQAEQAKSFAIAGGVAFIVLLALLAFILGRRAGRKKTTVVEIRRI